MANTCASVADSEPKTERFVFLKILTEDDKRVSNSVLTTRELPSKYFHPDELQFLVPSNGQSNDLKHGISEKMIITRQATDQNARNKSSGCATFNNSMAHHEISHKSKQNGTLSRSTASKIEGRKAPGANRILPLITSVWEDTDVHRKRQKSPKAGGERRDGKGKISYANKKNVTVDEAEEEWLERWDADDLGGSIYRAYNDFFMAEEAGEDREDCICSECGAEFLTATHVACHLESFHDKGVTKLHQCFVCRRKRYPSPLQLNQHLSEAHGIPRPQLTCRTCFMELAGESEAKAHSRKHQTPYKCSRCPLSHSQNGHCALVPRFATRFLLAEHLREVHLPSERPYVCSICGRHFIHEFVRDLHLQRRHMGHSLICPKVHHRQSSSCEEIALLSSKDFFNDTSVNSLTSNISPISNRSVSEDEGANCERASSFTENEDQLTSCKQDQVFVNHKKKRCEQFPENFMLIQQHSSLCCPKDSFLFPDEVSLLRHVFKCHEKPTRVQLLKWAREVDREDTLFEELWKVYLNTSNKQSALNITVSEENKIVSFIPNQSDVRVLPTSERLSVNIYSLNKQHGNENLTKNVVGKRSIPAKQDELFELSRIINPSNNCSDDKAIFPNDAVLSATFPQGINKSLQCNTNLTAEYSSMPASVTASLHGKSFVESTLSHVENVYNVSSVSATIQPFIPDTDSQKNKSPTRSLENPIKGMQTNISDSVNFCLTDILDTVCDVLNGRSSLKELKNLPGHSCVQRGLSNVRCSLCRYLASNALALERHRRRRHFRNKRCPFCSSACLSVDAVWRHVSETHLSSSIREEVDHDVSKVGAEELQQKIQSQKLVQSSSGLRCPVCKKTFSSRGKCNSHQENVHKIEVVSRPLRCSICSKKFQFQKALERHNLLHSQDKLENGTQTPYGCPHCEQTFLRPGFLKRHVASHFEDVRKEGKGKAANGLFGHSCLSCSRRLPTHGKLKAHVRTSHPPSHLRQRFVCSQCPVRCNTASGLRVHMRVHTGERPYPCSECNMSFKRQTALRKHLVAVHVVPSESSASETAGTGSFLQCPNCSSSFRDRSNLVRHFLQVHRGLRRFVCGLCGTKYGQNQDLRRHLKVNHDVDAPRIIGSDRRSVDQIYVVPPVIDDLPFDHPLVNKIRVIVEEEERKLNEDGIPHFTETPQQLHLHIHKEPVLKNAESTSDENKDTEPRSHIDHDCIKSPESAFDERHSSVLRPKASVRNMSKSNVNKVIEQASFLGDNKKTLDSKSSSVQLSSRVEIMMENKEPEDKNLPQPQRNLILDALISSQISSDAIQHDNSILCMEEVSQLGQVFGSNCSTAKSLDNDTPQAIEMNIIMTKQRLDSEHLKSSLQKSEDKSLIAADAIKTKEETSRMYPVVQGNFPCCHCGKEFIDAARLERHYKVHSDLKPHICSVCGKSFVEKYNLKVHMRTHTGERPYKCESCGKKVRYLKELADHRRMHLGERPHTCDICSRAFLRLRDLQRHLQIHLSKKKHQCPICNKAFSRLDHLRAVHMRVHDPWRSETSKTSDKAVESVSDENGLKLNAAKNPIVRCTNSEKEIHECQKCNKKFSTRAKLDKHLVLHSGQKAHKCSACGRSFALASYLRAHQNTHRKQQAYLQCPKCPRRFVSQETLSVHDDKFHRRIEKMKKFQSLELNEKAGRSKDLSVDICDEERFFMTRTGDFDVNLNLEEEMSIQEVLFDPTSLPESEKHNTFVYLHVISDDLQLANENGFTE